MIILEEYDKNLLHLYTKCQSSVFVFMKLTSHNLMNIQHVLIKDFSNLLSKQHKLCNFNL